MSMKPITNKLFSSEVIGFKFSLSKQIKSWQLDNKLCTLRSIETVEIDWRIIRGDK